MNRFGFIVIITVLLPLSGCFWVSPSGVNPDERSLAPCPDSPNCVSSREEDSHAIEPLRYEGSVGRVRERLVSNVTEHYSASVEVKTDTYVYATVTTTLGFVDDMEFRFVPERQLIHVRSASRVGHSDLGTNRERVEFLRQSLTDPSDQVY